MRKISVLALILALAISVTGCFGGETKLYDAFNKMQDVTSAESDMEIGFTFATEGFSEEEQLMLQQVSAMVNSTKLKMHVKQTQNKEKTVAQAQVDMSMDLGGMIMPMNVWVDMDMSTDKPKMVEIIKMPQMLMASMFPNEPAKQYIVYDIGEMMNMENEEVNFSELVKFSKDLQPKMTEFIKEIQKDFKPDFKIIKEKEKREVDGKKLEIYELKLDDATLKELIKYSVNYSLDNETIIEFIKEYMNTVMNIAITSETDKQAAEAEIKKELEELEKQIPEFKVKFNEFMEKYKDVKILGEKGILIEYGIDKDGYIVHEVGTIDLRIDLAQIAKVAGEENQGVKGIINLGINYNSKVYNINNKDIKVEMPTITKENSVDFMEMMEVQMQQMPVPVAKPEPEPVKVP